MTESYYNILGIEKNESIEKIKKYIKNPFMLQVCNTMTKDEHIDFMTKVIFENEKENDAKYLAEIIHNLQRKLFEFENKRWTTK